MPATVFADARLIAVCSSRLSSAVYHPVKQIIAFAVCHNYGSIDHQITRERASDRLDDAVAGDAGAVMFVDVESRVDVMLCQVEMDETSHRPRLLHIQSDHAQPSHFRLISPSELLSPRLIRGTGNMNAGGFDRNDLCSLMSFRFSTDASRLVAVDVYGRATVFALQHSEQTSGVGEDSHCKMSTMLSICCFGNNDSLVDASFWSPNELVLARKNGHIAIWSIQKRQGDWALDLVGQPETVQGQPVLSDVNDFHVFAVARQLQYLRPRRSWTADTANAGEASAAEDQSDVCLTIACVCVCVCLFV